VCASYFFIAKKVTKNGVFVASFAIGTGFARNWQRGNFLHHHARKIAQW
jgi:hypothetical protein